MIKPEIKLSEQQGKSQKEAKEEGKERENKASEQVPLVGPFGPCDFCGVKPGIHPHKRFNRVKQKTDALKLCETCWQITKN